MHSMKHEAKASAKAKLSRMSAIRGDTRAGEGVEEDYGNTAAGPSSSARFARGGHVEGESAAPRMDKSPRRSKYAKGGKVKGKTIVNINVGQPQGQGQQVPVPIPVPAGGPPPGAQAMPPKPPMMMAPPPQGGPGMGGPPMPPPQGMPPGMPPPMMGRKRGGRIPMDAGAGSGVGRLEKLGKTA